MRTHEEPDSEVCFQLSSPRVEETESQIQWSATESDHYCESDFMTHGNFLVIQGSDLEEYVTYCMSQEDFWCHFRSLGQFRFL